MTTRQRAQRGDELKEFEGRVRKWRKEWQPAGDTVKTKNLKFYKWTPTDERELAAPGKRFPDIKPLSTPGGKPTLLPFFMRPAPPRAQAAVAFAPMPALKLKLNTGMTKQASGSQSTHAAQNAMSPPSVAPSVAPPSSMSPPNPK
ncbi:hypothetical protein Ndes2437B_g01118 [Nannochloris sp. 'desiccata']